MSSIAINRVFQLALDKKKHEIYELHLKYRLTPYEILTSLKFLVEKGVAIQEGNVFWMSEKITFLNLKAVYNATYFRSVELDKIDLDVIRQRSSTREEIYKPNFRIIDKSLKLD